MNLHLPVPSPEEIAGHWWLAATTDDFLTRRPFVHTVEVFAAPLSSTGLLLSAVCALPRRVARFRQRMRLSETEGLLSFALFPGSAMLMRSWRMGLTPHGDVFRVKHQGSMLLRGGAMLYVRYPSTEAQARALITTQARSLGLDPRNLDTLAWRSRPTPELAHLTSTAEQSSP